MAINIPIITEFNGKGIQKAIKQFKQLETNGQKAGFILKKAGQAAAVGFAAIGAAAIGAGVALWNFAKMAADDEKSQVLLARSLKATTKATDAQIKSTEKWISKTQIAFGIADDRLRPSLSRLVRSTKDVKVAQDLLNRSLDIAAATGRPLEAVVAAVGRAYDGNNTALSRLGLGLTKAQLKGKSFAEIMKLINDKVGGAAAAQAGTFQGKMDSLAQTFNELKETLGYGVLPYLKDFANWGIELGNILGKEGLGAAIDYLVDSLKQLVFYDKNGKLNAIGKSLQLAGKAFNFVSRTAGVVGGTLTANPRVIMRSLTDSKGTINTLNPYSDPFAAGARGGFLPKVTINFNGIVGDPVAVGRQIDHVLQRYGRRLGRVAG